MSSMTPSGPHSFIATVPGGATCAPGGTQPAANAKITASSANNANGRAVKVIAALIAGFAGASQATHARVHRQKNCSLPSLPVYFSCAPRARLHLGQGWTNDDSNCL